MATNKNDGMLTVDKEIQALFRATAKKEGMTIKYLARKLIQDYCAKNS